MNGATNMCSLGLRLNIAADINRFHELASQRADEAIDHAKQAGLLLMQVKATLNHGEWLPWLEQNIFVSARQVQRYLQLAQGRALPMRAIASSEIPKISTAVKNDKVTHLKDWMPRPKFIPLNGFTYVWARVEGEPPFWIIEPSKAHKGFFFLTHLEPDGECVYLSRPIAATFVEGWLQGEGMDTPSEVEWELSATEGVMASVGMLAVEAEVSA